MKKSKLFAIAFILAFTITAALCILGGHPLIFLPVSYKIVDFITFAILIAFLCVGLVFVTLPLLDFIRRTAVSGASAKGYYIVYTFLILQFLTLTVGFLESAFTPGVVATAFYYYQGVGNSLVYILTGNLTAAIISLLHAKTQEDSEKLNAPKFYFED